MKVISILTNYAREIAPDLVDPTAEFLAPTVPTGAASGRYKDFGSQAAFQIPKTRRETGGPANRMQFEESDGTYDCTSNALEIGIDKIEIEQAGSAGLAMLQRVKTSMILSGAFLAHTKEVADLADTAAAVGGGAWSNDANDPIAEIDADIVTLNDTIGKMPNRLLLSLAAFQKLRNNAKVKERQPGSTNIGLTAAQLQAMLINPTIQIHIGTLPYDTAKLGKTSSKASVLGAKSYVFYSSPNPTVMDASFMKTFRVNSTGIDQVGTYYDERHRSDILALDWTQQIKITSLLCVRKRDIT